MWIHRSKDFSCGLTKGGTKPSGVWFSSRADEDGFHRAFFRKRLGT